MLQRNLLMLLVLTTTLCASATDRTLLTGFVRDGEGKPLGGVTVTLAKSKNQQTIYHTISGTSGEYRFASVSDGDYTLTAELGGYNPAEIVLVRIQSTLSPATADITLLRQAPMLELGVETSQAPPVFQAAGIRGIIDPGGYSASSSGAASGLLRGIADLKRTDRSFGTSSASAWPCSREPELRRAVAEHMDRAEPNRELGLFYLAHDEPTKAIPPLNRALELENDGTDFDASRGLVVAWIESGDFENARRLLTPLMKSHDEPELHQLMARAYEGVGMFLQAAQEYRLAEAEAPSEESLFGAGYELILAGSPADSIAVFDNALTMFPRSIPLHIGAGTAQFLLGNIPMALRSFLAATYIDPADPRPYTFLASASESSDAESDRVRSAFKRFLDDSPNNGAANFFYALALSRGSSTGEEELIETLAKRAIHLDPSLARAHLLLADSYARRKDYEAAIPEYESSVRLSQGLSEAHYRLAMAYRRTGHLKESAREIEIFRASKKRESSGSGGNGIDVMQFISVMDTSKQHTGTKTQCPDNPR